MNLTESLAFDTENARCYVEELASFDRDTTGDMLDASLTAYEIIDLMKIEIVRLHALELEDEIDGNEYGKD